MVRIISGGVWCYAVDLTEIKAALPLYLHSERQKLSWKQNLIHPEIIINITRCKHKLTLTNVSSSEPKLLLSMQTESGTIEYIPCNIRRSRIIE
jgi:hypothetical protein